MRALLYDPAVVLPLPDAGHAGDGGRHGGEGCPTRLPAASLRLDGVYYSLEYDAEDWDRHADNAWLQHQMAVHLKPAPPRLRLKIKHKVREGKGPAARALLSQRPSLSERRVFLLLTALSLPHTHNQAVHRWTAWWRPRRLYTLTLTLTLTLALALTLTLTQP